MTLFRDLRFAHMGEVFAPKHKGKSTLPFSEFITDHGIHPIAYISASGEHVGYEHHYRARYSIPRKGGAVTLSVISGSQFHCKPDAPYEVMISGAEPLDYVTDEELMILLARIVTGDWHPDNEDKEKDDGL